MPGDLLNIGGLTEPMTALVEKVSDAIGGIAKPRQIVRVAKAEARADLIRAESEIEIAELRFRAASRFVNEEARKQLNMETILHKALPHVTDDAYPGDMDDDWVVNFFEKSRTVSDEEMQELWARVLAGEANGVGTFSRKTINILHDMDKQSAELFRTLCGYMWNILGNNYVLVYPGPDYFDPIYDELGVTFHALVDLESLGVLNQSSRGFVWADPPEPFTTSYFGRPVDLSLSSAFGNDLNLGGAMLTGFGRQLASICDAAPVVGFFEFVCAKWESDPAVESVRVL